MRAISVSAAAHEKLACLFTKMEDNHGVGVDLMTERPLTATAVQEEHAERRNAATLRGARLEDAAEGNVELATQRVDDDQVRRGVFADAELGIWAGRRVRAHVVVAALTSNTGVIKRVHHQKNCDSLRKRMMPTVMQQCNWC